MYDIIISVIKYMAVLSGRRIFDTDGKWNDSGQLQEVTIRTMMAEIVAFSTHSEQLKNVNVN